MIDNLKKGTVYKTKELTVGEKDTALAYGSGGLEVLSTPAMIALMEKAAYCLLVSYPVEVESVGTMMNVKHTRACAPGAIVYASAEVTGIDGNKVNFSVKAYDGKGEIGSGEHTRYIIDPARFMKKLKEKED